MPSNDARSPLYGRRRDVIAAAALVIAALATALLTSSSEEAPVTAGSPVVPSRSSSDAVLGALDTPSGELVIGTKVHVAGWALHAAGIARVEVRLDGRSYEARYGLAREDVAKVKPGYPDSTAPGFVFDVDFGNLDPVRHVLEIVAVNRTGGESVIARKSLVPAQAMRLWSGLLDARPGLAERSFRFLMATSGVASGGAAEVGSAYDGYLSRTQHIGITVPILYMRTTKGAAHDWLFDPDFGSGPKCGDHPVADDSLNGVIRTAIEKRLPVQFALNGGIWSNASCGTPEWDLNDYLEQDANNCQWTQRNVVFPADYVKNLPGSTESPRLARSLSYNVYATTVRAYKRRNLQAAARIIATFSREHPDLFVGVNLDADTYMNPFVREGNWYDYNPGMLKQFRHWLAGSRPYAGKPDADAPNLVAYRRKDPLTLADVNRLAHSKWKSWDEVDPPRRFRGPGGEPLAAGDVPYWQDPWYREWDAFRKHVVALHYSELSRWALEAGIPRDQIFSAQAFIAPDPGLAPISLHIRGSSPNYDSAGVSIEGSIPAYGHAGAILYGPAAANEHPMEDGHSLFSTLARMDPGWAVVETNATDLKTMVRPTYAQSYHAFRDLFNFDARQVSVMAWNGSNGAFADQPGYVPYTSWRNTPAEAAMRDFLVTHADLPLGARLWTFGAVGHAEDDGWRLEQGRLGARGGHADLVFPASMATLLSPPDQVIRPASTELLVLGIADPATLAAVAVYARRNASSPWRRLGAPIPTARLKHGAAGWQVPLAWPQEWRDKVRYVEEIKIVLVCAPGTATLRLDRIALYPAARRVYGAARP